MTIFTNARLHSGQSTPHEDVVIAGISGHFPESANVYQLRDNLFNKVNMVAKDNESWKYG
jgi:acyl transferase domain-containing protein